MSLAVSQGRTEVRKHSLYQKVGLTLTSYLTNVNKTSGTGLKCLLL